MPGTAHNARYARRQRNGLLYTGLAEIVFGAFWVVGGRFIPMVGPYWTVVGFGLMGLGVVLVLFAFGSSRRLAKVGRIAASGVAGRARVRSVQPTGTIINGVPSVRLDLEVHLDDHAPYRVDGLKHAGMLPVDTWVTVVVSGDDPEELLISDTGGDHLY